MIKNYTLKKLSLFAAAITAVSSLSLAASAEEEMKEILPYMEEGFLYEVDMNADGITEQLHFDTYTDESNDFCNAVLNIYLDDVLCYNITEEDWSYNWTLDAFTLEDGKTYLLACCKSDSDWDESCLILSYSPEAETLFPIADLAAITRESESLPDYFVSGWGRCFYVDNAAGSTFTVSWSDTLMSTGSIAVPITYEITDNTVSVVEQPSPLDADAEWTAWYEFDTYTEPGSDTVSFHVSADEVVSLTEMFIQDGVTYVKCVNQNGEEGWYADPEEYISGGQDAEGNYLGGYFKECIFAG